MIASACRTLEIVPRRPYRTEFTSRRTFPDRTVSRSITLDSSASEIPSCARLAIKELNTGLNGGSVSRLRNVRSRKFSRCTVPELTFTIIGQPYAKR